MNQRQVLLIATALYHNSVVLGALVQHGMGVTPENSSQKGPARDAMLQVSRMREAAGDLKIITQTYINEGIEFVAPSEVKPGLWKRLFG